VPLAAGSDHRQLLSEGSDTSNPDTKGWNERVDHAPARLALLKRCVVASPLRGAGEERQDGLVAVEGLDL
jgi:hypothetical protein